MKVFRKMFAFAVTVAAIAMATSAFAATAEYDATNKLVKVANTSALDNETAQATVAVVKSTFDGTNDADIYFIDQNTADVIAENLKAGLKIKDAITVPTDYQVRVAGTNTAIQAINFKSIQESSITKVGDANAVGFTGTFQYNGGTKKVLLTFKDGTATGDYTWDLGDAITASNATIVFGLEIQPDAGQDVSGIELVSIADAQ